MKNFFYIFLFFILLSCGNIEFLNSDKGNLTNPIYNKTKVITSGVDLSFVSSYIPMFFGNNKENYYSLSINIKERKTKTSIESNQAASNIRYELRFDYVLVSVKKKCVIYEKEILSNFSIIPKSSGYNYGTDSSLEKKYELVVIENLNRFVSFLSGINLEKCR